MIFTTIPRRLRILCAHPNCTTTDLRLFAQVELNVMRVTSYSTLSSISLSNELVTMESDIERAVEGSSIDLDLWLQEWTTMTNSTVTEGGSSLHDLNLQIQHAYATLTLHLRALSASGIDNIAIMTNQSLAVAAKRAAERHLRLVLTRTGEFTAPNQDLPDRAYLTSFKYAMRFVWAKCAFSVLLVLRLSMLLKDPVEQTLGYIAEAREVLLELERLGGEVIYTRILALSIEKCQGAIRAIHMQDSNTQTVNQSPCTDAMSGSKSRTTPADNIDGAAETDFQSYVPQEFLFDFAFPGLNLYYIPLDWQDLFVDFGAVF